jgi:hypothetical protein
MTAPKLFVSYSWSDAEHEQWVIDLATELRESGVDVILDKWDLKEGHDAVAFMEKMATDPEIKKVAIICDEKYAAKADGRAGGVGTETQIISREVYENQAQEKFVAVVCEKDENGKAYLPTYYKSRIDSQVASVMLCTVWNLCQRPSLHVGRVSTRHVGLKPDLQGFAHKYLQE